MADDALETIIALLALGAIPAITMARLRWQQAPSMLKLTAAGLATVMGLPLVGVGPKAAADPWWPSPGPGARTIR